MTPVMIPDPHMEPDKTIIHPSEAQDQIQPRLHQRHRERARMMHQEQHHQHRLQHPLHVSIPFRKRKRSCALITERKTIVERVITIFKRSRRKISFASVTSPAVMLPEKAASSIVYTAPPAMSITPITAP